MKHLLPSSALALCAAAVLAPLTAQNSALNRSEYQPTTTQGLQTFAGWYTWRLASPDDGLPANPTAGTLASARMAYLVHPDQNGNGDVTLEFHRSTDGGRNWNGPTTLHTLPTGTGAALNSEYETVLDVTAAGNFVYVFWMSNEHAPTGSDQSAWVMGSDDQGVTWTPPFQLSSGLGGAYADCNELQCVATTTGLHCAWLGDTVSGKPVAGNPQTGWTGNGAQFDGDYVEDVYYTRVIAAGGAIAPMVGETNLTGFNGAFNCDWLSLDAENDVVHVVWNDSSDPGLPAGNQDRVTRSATSIDGGVNFSLRTHTPVYGGSWDRRWFRGYAAVDSYQGTTYAYTFSEDGRGGIDAIYMDRATVTAGPTLTWTDLGIAASNLSGETEGFRVDVHRGLILIATVDYSAGNTYAIFDAAGGAEFLAGMQRTHLVQTGLPNWEWEIPVNNYFHDIDVNGGIACATFEDCSPEDAHLIVSTDRGQTVELIVATRNGGCGGGTATVDVDEVFCAVSGNGDINLVNLDNRNGGTNANNELFVYGTKFPTLRYDPATLTLTLEGLDPATARTRIAYLAVSGGTAGVDVPGSLLSGAGGYGHFVGLTPDPFYFGLWRDIFPWLRAPNAQGIATWNGIPPLSALIGQPIHVVAGTLDASVYPPRFESYTDPIRL